MLRERATEATSNSNPSIHILQLLHRRTPNLCQICAAPSLLQGANAYRIPHRDLIHLHLHCLDVHAEAMIAARDCHLECCRRCFWILCPECGRDQRCAEQGRPLHSDCAGLVLDLDSLHLASAVVFAWYILCPVGTTAAAGRDLRGRIVGANDARAVEETHPRMTRAPRGRVAVIHHSKILIALGWRAQREIHRSAREHHSVD